MTMKLNSLDITKICLGAAEINKIYLGIDGVYNRPWTPNDITTALWLDASDLLTITESDGSVSSWADKSGNGINAIQVSGSNQPTTNSRTMNGLNILDFDGLSHYFTLSNQYQVSSNNNMIFAVIDYDELEVDTYAARIINGNEVGGGTRHGLFFRKSSGTGLLFVNNNTFIPIGTGIFENGQKIISGYRDGLEGGVGYDGTYSTNTTVADVSTLTDFGIGATAGGQDRLDGAIAEIIVVLNYSVADRQKIEGYLAHKWGLTSNLPVDHPYKTNAPTI